MLLEFDPNNALGEAHLDRTFYDSLKPSIKFWIANVGQDMPWDHLVSVANKAEDRAKI